MVDQKRDDGDDHADDGEYGPDDDPEMDFAKQNADPKQIAFGVGTGWLRLGNRMAGSFSFSGRGGVPAASLVSVNLVSDNFPSIEEPASLRVG